MENEILSAIEGEVKNQEIVSLSHIRAKRTIPFPPAFRLPPETLEVIFILGACDFYESKGGHFTPCVPAWVNVSYVCRHWRNIALNCPTLWTYHFIKSVRWTKELRLRSKHAPLKISFCQPFDRVLLSSLRVLKEVLEHTEQIQELCLDMLCPPKLSLSSPLLKNLDIRLSVDNTNNVAITNSDDLRLHTLTLTNCSLPWYSFNLSELKTLSLYRVCPYSQPNVDKFLSVLSSMQRLTVLDLQYSLPSASDFLSSGGLEVSPRINLPHLALLALDAPLSTVVALFSCVDIPPTTQIHLDLLMDSGTTVNDYASISSFLAKQFSTLEQSSGLSFRSLCLDVGWTPSMTFTPSLTFSLNCEPLSAREEVSCNVPLKIFLEGFDDKGSELTCIEAHCVMRDICCSLPLANVQRLHVLWPEFSPNIWKDILGHMPGLRYMKLRYGDMPNLSLLSCIAHRPEEDLAGQPITDQSPIPSHMVVPALEELELHEIEFVSGSMSSNKWMSKDSLLDAISTRAGLRDRVIMRNCRG